MIDIMDFHQFMLLRGYSFEQIISSLTFTPTNGYVKGPFIVEQFDYDINEDNTCQYFNQYIIYNNKGFVHYSGPATYNNIINAEEEIKTLKFRLSLLWHKILTSINGIIKTPKKVQIKPSSLLNLPQSEELK